MTNFFGPGSPYLRHPLLTTNRSAREVDRVLSWCPTPPHDVIDLGCGFGRHCIEFARRGLATTGVDPSVTLLDEARQRAVTAELEIEFVESGGEAFVRPDSFDLAIAMFTTLGQVASADADPQIAATLSNLHTSLRPGGTLVIEVPERDRAVANLVEYEQLGPTEVTRSFDPETRVLSERFETPTGTYDLAYVLLSKEELTAELQTAGFVVEAVHDEAVSPPPDTFMTIVARA